MKKILIPVLCCALLLAGCNDKPDEHIQPPTETIPLPTNTSVTEPVEGDTVLYAVSVPAITETYQAEDGTELFSYTGQHMQLILPNEDVADNVVLDFLK